MSVVEDLKNKTPEVGTPSAFPDTETPVPVEKPKTPETGNIFGDSAPDV